MPDHPEASFRPYHLPRLPEDQLVPTARALFAEADGRRTVRDFSPDPVPREAIEYAIRTASTAPSGAHRQPWTFVLVADARMKRAIREAAEAEERENYEGGRLPEHWREAVAPLGTTSDKPFLEIAPWLVVVFEQRYGVLPDGSRQHNYYVKESVGIACGIFISTLHRLGLATLTHTPSPMAFLTELLQRPSSERPFILFPVGFAADDSRVPDLKRKRLSDVMVEAPT